MSKTAVIVQPCFFPWRGQFDLFSRGDVPVLLDTVQYVRRGWFNRNRIMTANGPAWITVPVQAKGNYYSEIREIAIHREDRWQEAIIKSIYHAYCKYPCFQNYYDSLSDLLNRDWIYLADLSQAAMEWCFIQLHRPTSFIRASELDISAQNPVERLIQICKTVGADRYLSGPSAKDYIGEGQPFRDAGIELAWMEYQYPEYPQVRTYLDEPLSVLDLLFNVGENSPQYIWG